MAMQGIPDVILLDNVTAAAPGDAFGIGGQQMRFDNKSASGVNKNQYRVCLKVRLWMVDTGYGATSTVLFQTSPDKTTWTTQHTWSLALLASSGSLIISPKDCDFKTYFRYIRLNPTALTGGTAPALNAYCALGTYNL